MLLTDDGHFSLSADTTIVQDEFPRLSGQIRIALTAEQKKALAKTLERQKKEGRSFWASAYLLGRSGHAQVGLDLMPRLDAPIRIKDHSLDIDIDIMALGECREAWLEELQKLVRSGHRVRIGRLLVLDRDKRLTSEQIEDAIKHRLIACKNPYTIGENGLISITAEPVEFIYEARAFADKDVLRSILLHSRNALVQFRDSRRISHREIPPKSLYITGIRFSSGPFPALIQHHLSDQLKHVRGGVFLDEFRSTRIGNEYGASGLRQIEVFNDSSEPYDLSQPIQISLGLYASSGENAAILESLTTRRARGFWHMHGVSFASATDLASEDVQALLFSRISGHRTDDSIYGRIVTDQGVTSIPWGATYKFQRLLTERAIKDPAGKRDPDPAFRQFMRKLRLTIDQGRVLIVHNLPRAEELIHFYDLGITAFIFKGIRTTDAVFAGGDPNASINIHLDSHIYETILSLYKRGVSFNFIVDEPMEDGGKGPVHFFEFFKGFWCRPDAKLRLDKIEIVVNMYGWHKDSLADENEAAIEAFLEKIADFVGRDRLAVMHGKGPGFMRVADYMARKLGILSIGVGIDAEKVGQISNIMPEIALDFESNERLYRQKLMDHIGDIKVFNIGGFGTEEESAITVCSAKLLEFMPAPMLYIDTSSGKIIEGHDGVVRDNHWLPLWQQIENISKTTSFEFTAPDGETRRFDLTGSPLGPNWVAGLCHCLEDYAEAADIVVEFLSDPQGYWSKHHVDVDGSTIKFAWNNYLKKRNHYQLRPARIYEEVLKKY